MLQIIVTFMRTFNQENARNVLQPAEDAAIVTADVNEKVKVDEYYQKCTRETRPDRKTAFVLGTGAADTSEILQSDSHRRDSRADVRLGANIKSKTRPLK